MQGLEENRAFREELDRAEQQRATTAYNVWDRYEIAGDVIRLVPPYRIRRMYFPMGSPNVVPEFARITPGDAATGLRFVRRWGLLGYSAVGRESEAGDPVDWIWAHANGVSAVLRVRKLLSNGNDERLLEYIDSLNGSRFGQRQHIRPWESGHFGPQGDEEPVQAVASRLFNTIINPNQVGVSRQISDAAPTKKLAEMGRYHLVYEWDALISVVYWHLADLVVGGHLRVCDGCGLPFLQTHARQRFCPALPPERSLCEQRYTKALQRRKGRKS